MWWEKTESARETDPGTKREAAFALCRQRLSALKGTKSQEHASKKTSASFNHSRAKGKSSAGFQEGRSEITTNCTEKGDYDESVAAGKKGGV